MSVGLDIGDLSQLAGDSLGRSDGQQWPRLGPLNVPVNLCEFEYTYLAQWLASVYEATSIRVLRQFDERAIHPVAQEFGFGLTAKQVGKPRRDCERRSNSIEVITAEGLAV
ncbi:MAG: hypothetical protein ABWY23_10615 [Mycetocola sp.]